MSFENFLKILLKVTVWIPLIKPEEAAECVFTELRFLRDCDFRLSYRINESSDQLIVCAKGVADKEPVIEDTVIVG